MMETSFELIERRHIDTLNLEFQAYRHPASGARHFHLACEDDNNAFMVAFPTIPQDSTGVAHILEHTTLCGSQRYPVRDPFFMMLRRSLNTFMNAFTSSDSTAYPFATRNRKDFDNLLQVYLDAVFFPLLDPLDFAQEGCRVEFADAEQPAAGLVYKGVVFNEMKGAMSSPVAQLWHHLQAALFPQTAYRYNSGGDPAAIPDLTHAALRAFHARHYSPAQAVFITYGCFDPRDHQARFESLALARHPAVQAAAGAPVVSALQPPLSAPRELVTDYAIDESFDSEESTHLVWGWLLGESADPRVALEAQMLAGVLLEHSASPMRHFLETTELARAPSELCGTDDSARQLAFYLGVEGSEAAHAAELEQGLLAVLQTIATNGMPHEVLSAVLDRIEMAQRDVGGDGYPYGLQLMSRILPGAMYRRDPVALLDIDPLLEELRQEVANPDYFPALVRRLLLDNPHRARVTMVPNDHKREAERQAELDRLAALNATLDDAARKAIADAASALASRQARVEDPDALPRITLADVPAGEPLITGEVVDIAGLETHRYTRGTNGLMRAQLAIELPALSEDEIRTLSSFAGYLTDFGAAGETYLDTQARRALVGSFGANASIRSHLTDVNASAGHVVIWSKGLQRRTPELIQTLGEILPDFRCDETQRLRELLTQARADLEMSITDRGHQLAMHGAMRGLSPSAWLGDLWDGPTQILSLQAQEDAVRESDAAALELLGKYAALKNKLLTAPCKVLLVGETEALDSAAATLARHGLRGQRSAGAGALVLPSPRVAPGSAWLANGEVNFCAKAYAAVPEGAPDAPALSVLARYLSDGFLHPAVRERGGAYGGGANYDADSAAFSFYSYRDPRLVDTLADFDRSLDWLHEAQPAELLEEAILGVIRRLDKPRSPAGAAISWFFNEIHGRDAAFRARFREQVLATTVADLRRVASTWLTPETGVIGVVSHAGERATIDALGLQRFSF